MTHLVYLESADAKSAGRASRTRGPSSHHYFAADCDTIIVVSESQRPDYLRGIAVVVIVAIVILAFSVAFAA